MISALRWAAMWAVLMFHSLCWAKSRDSVHKSQFLKEKGEPKRGVEPASFRLPAERFTTRPSRLTVAHFSAVDPFISISTVMVFFLFQSVEVLANTLHSYCSSWKMKRFSVQDNLDDFFGVDIKCFKITDFATVLAKMCFFDGFVFNRIWDSWTRLFLFFSFL